MRRTAPLLVVVCTVALAACSGGGSGDDATTPTTDPAEEAYTQAMAQVAGVARETWDAEHVLDVGRAVCEHLAAGDAAVTDVLPWVIAEYGAEDSAAVAAATQAPRHLCPAG